MKLCGFNVCKPRHERDAASPRPVGEIDGVAIDAMKSYVMSAGARAVADSTQTDLTLPRYPSSRVLHGRSTAVAARIN